MVDNMYEFQQLHILMQDSRVQRGRKHVCQLKAFKLPSVEATTRLSVFVSGLQLFEPDPSLAFRLRLVVECGIHGRVEHPSCYLNKIIVLKQ